MTESTDKVLKFPVASLLAPGESDVKAVVTLEDLRDVGRTAFGIVYPGDSR